MRTGHLLTSAEPRVPTIFQCFMIYASSSGARAHRPAFRLRLAATTAIIFLICSTRRRCATKGLAARLTGAPERQSRPGEARMRRLFFALIALCPLAATAREGRYLGPDNEVFIRRLSGERYEVAVTALRAPGDPPCGGGIVAIATIPAGSNSAIARRENDTTIEETSRYCSVRLRFRGARTLEIAEDGCSSWHGGSCGFTGTLTRRRATRPLSLASLTMTDACPYSRATFVNPFGSRATPDVFEVERAERRRRPDRRVAIVMIGRFNEQPAAAAFVPGDHNLSYLRDGWRAEWTFLENVSRQLVPRSTFYEPAAPPGADPTDGNMRLYCRRGH